MELLILLIFLCAIYGQSRYSLKRNLALKRVMISHFKSVKSGERMMQAMLVSMLAIGLLLFLYFGVDKRLLLVSFRTSYYVKGLFLILLSILAFVQVFFLVGFLISIPSKQDGTNIINEIDLLAVDPNSFIFSGYIIPIGVASFETLVFYQIIFRLLVDTYKISNVLSCVIIVLLYGLLKAAMRDNIKQAYAFFIMGVSMSSVGLALTIGTQSLIIGGVYMFFCLLFIAFKNMKVNLGAR